jgi:hypothetical protein
MGIGGLAFGELNDILQLSGFLLQYLRVHKTLSSAPASRRGFLWLLAKRIGA